MTKLNRLFNLNENKPKLKEKPQTYLAHKIHEVTYSHNGATKSMRLHSSNILSDDDSIRRYMDKYYKGSKIIEIRELEKE